MLKVCCVNRAKQNRKWICCHGKQGAWWKRKLCPHGKRNHDDIDREFCNTCLGRDFPMACLRLSPPLHSTLLLATSSSTTSHPSLTPGQYQPLSLKVILQSSRYIIAHSRSIKRIGLHIMAIRYKLLHARIFYSSLISAKLALNEAFQPCKRGDSPGQEAWISWAGRGRGDYAIEWLSPTNDHFSQLLHNIWWLYSNKAAQ